MVRMRKRAERIPDERKREDNNEGDSSSDGGRDGRGDGGGNGNEWEGMGIFKRLFSQEVEICLDFKAFCVLQLIHAL